ncbi:hypothetical protein BWI93_04555 [Siphonobacter sp. BAB-5385]|uniref:hypothetical protein n=1 Tax=Siphonobacter sp. BAB-5385 TaxID=1864822 RepID=UPI000B9DF115|nr:hypothetical protein [Siphonobacter sp. BAB-5385]OZI09335.1 hypothetical protein BWI93_04555 [Siphonobacter sp. BAB-5385]
MTALQALHDLALHSKRANHPTFPEKLIPKPKFSDKTANGLTKCIVAFIRLQGFQAERVSVEGRVLDGRKTFQDAVGYRRTIGTVKRIRSSAQVGSADVSAIINGRSVKIEVKVGNDRQSQAQKEYQRQVEAAGGIYLLISSFQQFYDWYLQRQIHPAS